MTMRQKEKIEAVILDMDGILIDSERHWQLTERAIFAELGIELSDALLVETRGLRTEEMVAHVARQVHGSLTITWQGHEIDLTPPWRRIPLREAIMDPIGASTTWRWHGYHNSWIELDGLEKYPGFRRLAATLPAFMVPSWPWWNADIRKLSARSSRCWARANTL